jgi:hypothetical protein
MEHERVILADDPGPRFADGPDPLASRDAGDRVR